MFFIFLVNLIYALVNTLGKVALLYSTPMFLASFRMILAGLLTLSYQAFFCKEKIEIPMQNIGNLIWGGILSIYIAGILEFCGLEYLTSAKICFLYNLYPMSSAVISYFMLNEKLSKVKWVGLTIGFLGAIPLLLSRFSGDCQLYRYLGIISLSEIAILGAIFACPMGWIPVQVGIAQRKYSPIIALGMTQIIGGLIALINSLYFDAWNWVPVYHWGYFLITAISLTLFSNILANALYIKLLKKYSYTLIAFSGFLTTFLAIFFDWIFFGYSIDYSFYLSTIITLFGFYLFYKGEFRK